MGWSRLPPDDPGLSFWVSLRWFGAMRLVTALVMLAAIVLAEEGDNLGSYAPALFLRTAVVYVVLAAVFAYLAFLRPRGFHLQLAAQLCLDLVVLTVLMDASGGTRSGLAILYLLPVAGVAILGSALLSMFFAALAALAILGQTVWRDLFFGVDATHYVQAGLYGAACLAIAVVMNQLAARLIRQERIALQRGQDLQSQLEINRIIVADMQDGVLLLSADGHLRALNPAAARMVHMDQEDAEWPENWFSNSAGREISHEYQRWRRSHLDGQPRPNEFEFSFPMQMPANAGLLGGTRATVRLRARFVDLPPGYPEEGEGVVFLEDLNHIEERAQQLKLAAMGRLTASIAHEIRNPLSAISHASALIGEEIATDSGKRLLGIVQDNTRRLNRIVEDILQLSRRAPVKTDRIALNDTLRTFLDEFSRDQQCAAELFDLSIYGDPVLRFNGEHLRQALSNMLQNAVRYASGAPGSVRITAVPVGGSDKHASGEPHSRIGRIELIVQDDGPEIDTETRHQLFEPFFTTHHRGTGLGLYLARELCLANDATLMFVPNVDESKKGGFVINAPGYLN